MPVPLQRPRRSNEYTASSIEPGTTVIDIMKAIAENLRSNIVKRAGEQPLCELPRLTIANMCALVDDGR